MPPRNASKSNGQTNVSKGGRPSTLVETHPELQTNYMEMKPMVYDDLNLPDENEISRMIKDFSGHFVRKEVAYLLYILVLSFVNCWICSMS